MSNIYRLDSNAIGNLGRRAAESRLQDKLDRDERNDERIAAVKLELQASMVAAMNGNVATVPCHMRGHESLQLRETTLNGIDAVLEALDAKECAELLAVVLAHSTCNTVVRLKAKLAERYAADHCEEIAEARGLIEG